MSKEVRKGSYVHDREVVAMLLEKPSWHDNNSKYNEVDLLICDNIGRRPKYIRLENN